MNPGSQGTQMGHLGLISQMRDELGQRPVFEG